MLDYVLQIALVQMFAIQNKSFPYMFAFAVGGVFSASQVLAEELYMLCGESGGDGARFSRLCRNNSHTLRNNSASFAGCLQV